MPTGANGRGISAKARDAEPGHRDWAARSRALLLAPHNISYVDPASGGTSPACFFLSQELQQQPP